MSAVHGSASFALAGLTLVLVCITAAACSSSGNATPGPPDAGYCESNGYGEPTGSSCVKGLCLVTNMGESCCGSVCPSCESKGLVSFTEAGVCPDGLCPSIDVTVDLQCCDSEPTVLPAGDYCYPSVTDAGVPEASGASADTGAPDSGAAEASEQ